MLGFVNFEVTSDVHGSGFGNCHFLKITSQLNICNLFNAFFICLQLFTVVGLKL